MFVCIHVIHKQSQSTDCPFRSLKLTLDFIQCSPLMYFFNAAFSSFNLAYPSFDLIASFCVFIFIRTDEQSAKTFRSFHRRFISLTHLCIYIMNCNIYVLNLKCISSLVEQYIKLLLTK